MKLTAFHAKPCLKFKTISLNTNIQVLTLQTRRLLERLRRRERTEGLFSMTLRSDPKEANKNDAKAAALLSLPGPAGRRRTKGFSERGVSRASEVLAFATLVTRSAERKGGQRQKILCAWSSNLDKSGFVTKT